MRPGPQTQNGRALLHSSSCHEFAPTIVWIEHDMQLVRDLADRALVLHYGRQLAIGTPSDVLTDPRAIEAYIGAS